MLDVDFSELDLGSRRKPVEWVVVAPAQPPGSSRQGEKTQGSRRTGGRRNAAARARRQAARDAKQNGQLDSAPCGLHDPQHDSASLSSPTSRFTHADPQQPSGQLDQSPSEHLNGSSLPHSLPDVFLLNAAQQHGFSPLSSSGNSRSFGLGAPGSGSSSPFHPFGMSGSSGDWEIAGYKEKGRRSTGSQAFGDSTGRAQELEGDESGYIAAEDDEGNVEYKLRLKNPSPVRFQQLVTQLKFRLSEGSGECHYYLGVQDDGKLVGLAPREQEISAAVLAGMAAEVGAASQLLHQLPVGQQRAALCVRVRRASVDHLVCTDLCVAVAGAVDSGKSTLVATLTHGCEGRPRLDDGQGAARMAVLRHKHEIESGRTSSISQQLLGYDDEGRVLNYGGVAALTAAEIGVAACKVVHFLDLGGHSKFLKTALYGLTCLRPDFMLLCVEMGLGLEPAAREHLAVALALRIPVALLLTKADLAQPGQLSSSLAELRATIIAAAAASSGSLSKQPAADACAPFLDTEAKATTLAAGWSQGLAPLTIPIFPVSSAAMESGAGLRAAFRDPPNHRTQLVDKPSRVIFQVDNTFEVRGVGSVVSGMVIRGVICVGAQLLMGPTEAATFSTVNVTCIQRCQVSVRKVEAGERATLAIHSPADGVGGTTSSASDLSSSLDTRSAPLCQEAYRIREAAGNGVVLEPAQGTVVQQAVELGQETGEMEWLPGALGTSFDHGSGSHMGHLQPQQAVASSPSNPPRKGAVLMDAGAEPRVTWEFEALLVLLSGHWPARGLLSGHWPPLDLPDGPTPKGPCLYDSGSDSAGGGSWNDRPLLGRTSSRVSKRRASAGTGYAPVVHCGSVRQAARVVAMQEIARSPLVAPQAHPGITSGSCTAAAQQSHAGQSLQPVDVPLGPAFGAAAVLTASGAAVPGMQGIPSPTRSRSRMHGSSGASPQEGRAGEEEGSKSAHDIGCIARVTLRFLHHPEWLQEDARIIVRDRTDGCTSGAGILEHISWQAAASSPCLSRS
ncbi:hypothetical protein WJX84_004097 [Apatococcus fuscideae]|uniref:Tr-type G domain-containing protein n=1 Tax=Apatococcus fuscideae TaxID=2026836 RepID=A0AAW1T8W5_9CHLO